MKQIASIVLLGILSFNWAGYRLLSGLLEGKADNALEANIEHSEYDQHNLVEIRVPLNTPYLSANSGDFERFDGEIELNRVHYKYVKRKIENGELVILCLPNEDKTRVQNTRMEFFKLVNDLNANNRGTEKHDVSVFKSFTTEYKGESNCWFLTGWDMREPVYSARCRVHIVSRTADIPEHPPRLC